MNVFEVLQAHHTFGYSSLIGGQNKALKTGIEIGDIFRRPGIEDEFLPVPYIGTGHFIINDAIPVQKKCPAVIDLSEAKIFGHVISLLTSANRNRSPAGN
jgi:hypothetical protein